MPTVRSHIIRYALLLLTLFWAVLSPLARSVFAQNHFTGRVVAVEAGDRVRVRLDNLEMTVHLHGVECPSEPEALREKARQYAARRVSGATVRVEVRGSGAKMTVYGEVYPAQGQSLNAEMVRVGLGKWARQYAPGRTDIEALENAARAARKGLWGDPNGANVALPPLAPRVSRPSPTPTPVRKPTPTPTVVSTATPPPVATPTATLQHPMPSAPPSVAAPPLLAVLPVLRPFLPLVFLALGVASVFTGILFALSGQKARGLPVQMIVGGGMALGMGLLLPLPLLLLSGHFILTKPILVIAVLLPLLALLLNTASRFYQSEQILRGVPRTPIGSLHGTGLVRVSGRTSAAGYLVSSTIGRIPGLYIREESFRYEPQSGRHGRNTPHQWVVLKQEVQTADFVLTDETGSIFVETDHADIHPMRVARFYNDVPVEKFFIESYSGDVRTEIYFIPAEANLTVWGRHYETAAPVPGTSEKRIGRDLFTDTLIIVEENPARLLTARPVYGLLLTLLAVVVAAAIMLSVAAPDTITRLVPLHFGGRP